MLSSVRGSSSALLRTSPRSTPLAAFSQQRSYVAEIWKNTKRSEVSAALARSQELYKTYKPVSPGIRHLRRPLNPHLFEGRPLRTLTVAKRKKGGRNGHGHITVRHRGGGHRQRIRIIDYKREAAGIHDVVRIEYDPNAVGNAKWSYIIATEGLRAGDEVRSFKQGIPADFLPGFETPKKQANASNQSLALGLLRSMTLKPGNVLPLHLIPPGTVINTISLSPTGPGILVRSAGTFGQVIAHEEGGRYSQVRLQSGEVRKILRDCCATIGKVSNPLWKNRNLGKAGRARWLGIRPSVRGVAMNANDHPHGGGRGKSKSNKHPVSIWGWGTKGTRTRKPGPKGPKNSNKMVIRERPRGKEKRGLA
ncbi:mitochondrial ribosomal protein subunit L2 [Flammula alnicola]|nr:mitochondrial ribosomal protein subunit L2 [Flammula alnicola]